MIVSTKHQFAYLDIPKTGTHSLTQVLMDRYDARRVGRMWHDFRLHSSHVEMTLFATLRNPFVRAVSSWWHLMFREDDRSTWRPLVGSLDLAALLRWWFEECDRDAPIRGDGVLARQSSFVRACGHKMAFVHLERIDTEMWLLPFWDGPANIPRRDSNGEEVTASDYGDWREIMTDEAAELVRQVYKEDFELGGYGLDWRESEMPMAEVV